VSVCVSTCWLTFLRDDPQGDAEAGVLDQLDDVGVRHVDDGLAVHGQDAVAHLQLPAAVGRASLDDAPDFMRHGCRIQAQHAAGEWRITHAARSLLDGVRVRLSGSAVNPRLT